jgi:hypothetical protein
MRYCSLTASPVAEFKSTEREKLTNNSSLLSAVPGLCAVATNVPGCNVPLSARVFARLSSGLIWRVPYVLIHGRHKNASLCQVSVGVRETRIGAVG